MRATNGSSARHNTRPGRRWPALAMWTAVSQAASSVTNFMLLVVVARTSDDADVGRIALVAIAYQVGLGSTRALLGEVALVRQAVLGSLKSAQMIRSALAVGGALGCCMVLIGLLGGGDGRTFLILGISFPLLVVQDSLRYVSFATGSPRRAAHADLCWLALFLVGAITAPTGPGVGTQSALALWAASGVASISLLDVRSVLDSRSVRSRWVRESSRISRAYVADYAITLATTVAPTLVVAAVAGLPDVGALRLALSYLGPITILWVALVNFATPVLARSCHADLRFERRLSVAAVCAVLMWTTAGFVLPSAVGTRVAGSSWPEMRAWLPWVGLGFCALGSYGGAVVGLRTRDGADAVVRARAAMVLPTLALPTIGFVLWDRAGFGCGVALAGGATSFLLWRELKRFDLRQRGESSS